MVGAIQNGKRVTPAQVLAFARGLTAHGFDLHSHAELRLSRLLFLLVENEQWPDDPRQLRSILAPALCSSPRQQTEFYALFDEFVKRPDAQRNPIPSPQARADRSGSRESDGVERLPHASGPRTWLRVTMAVLALTALAWEIQRTNPPPAPRPRPEVDAPINPTPERERPQRPSSRSPLTITGTVREPAGAPLKGALVQYLGSRTTTDAAGSFQLIASRDESFSVLVTLDGHVPMLKRREEGDSGELSVSLAPYQSSPGNGSATTTNQPPPPPVLVPLPGLRGWAWAHRAALERAAAALPFLALGLWWLYLYHRRSKLKRFLRPLELSVYRIGVPDAARQLLKSAGAKRAAQEFQRRQPRVSEDLAAAETVDASIRNGSRFTPVYAQKRVPPEYLVLIERFDARDQQARLYDELMQRLVKLGVTVDRYFFAADPRECTRNEQPFSLSDLAALHPHHDLWIVADSDKFLNRISGGPAAWVEHLQRWKNRVVLTSSTNNPYADWLLRAQEFRVVTADPAGLAQLPQTMARTNETSFVPQWERFPGLLREDPVRWLAAREPSLAVQAEMFTQVRRYLGPTGYDCLSACAVYPALSWNLTVDLVSSLAAGEPPEPILARLVRLPWFRRGSMPEWVRSRLAERLPNATAGKTNAAIERFLESSAAFRGKGDEWLEYGGETARQQARSFLNRLKARFGRETPQGPAQDYVFLSFLWRRHVGQLAPGAPSRLRKILFRRGYAMFGVEPVAHAGMGLLLAAIAWFAVAAGTKDLQPVAAPAPPPSYPAGFKGATLDIARAMLGQSTGVPDADFVNWCALTAAEILGKTPHFPAAESLNSLGDLRAGDRVTVDGNTAYVLAVHPPSLELLRQTNGLVEYLHPFLDMGKYASVPVRMPDPPDATPVSPGDYLPGTVDWSRQMSPARIDESELTLGVAVAEVMEFLIRKQLHQEVELSSRYIEYRDLLREGSQAADSATTFNDAAAEMRDIGAITEQAWRRDEKKITTQAKPGAVETGPHYRVSTFRRLESAAAIRSALAAGPVAIDFAVGNSVASVGSSGILPMAPLAGAGSLNVAAVGYDDEKKLIKFLNSWGAKWGDNGYGYLPYSYQGLHGMALSGIALATGSQNPVGTCTGPEVKVFDNWNTDAANNSGKPPSFDTADFKGSGLKTDLFCLVSIATYHFNGGKGALPGKIGLTDSAGKYVVGPWSAAGSGGRGGAPNVNWVATVAGQSPIVLRGKYTVTDSSPGTWSQNSASHGMGFVRVTVREYADSTKPGTAGPPQNGSQASAIGKLMLTLEGHTGLVETLAWSPDGKILASGGGDDLIRLWDSATGKMLSALKSTDVTSLQWSPDGRTLAAAMGSFLANGGVQLWDTASRQLRRTLRQYPAIDPFGVFGIAWSPDGKTVASANEDKTIQLWDPDSGKVLRTLVGHQDKVLCVAWSPNGETLASGSADNTIRLWEPASGKVQRTLTAGQSYVHSVAWSPDGKTLESAGSDGTIGLWDPATGRKLLLRQAHASAIGGAPWRRYGKTLATGGIDGVVRLWNVAYVAGGQELGTLPGKTAISAVAWSPDGTTLAAGLDSTIRLWSIPDVLTPPAQVQRPAPK